MGTNAHAEAGDGLSAGPCQGREASGKAWHNANGGEKRVSGECGPAPAAALLLFGRESGVEFGLSAFCGFRVNLADRISGIAPHVKILVLQQPERGGHRCPGVLS